VTAQNWLDLRAERGLSTFDQRNLMNATIQYTSGVGLGGGALLGGWRGKLLRRWTVTGQITAASGLPETPVYLAAVAGTGVTGSIRPSLTGAPLYSAPAGLHLNPAAYKSSGGRRNGRCAKKLDHRSGQFVFNGQLQRSFRLKDRLQPGSASGFNEPAQPRCVYQLEHDIEPGLEPSLK